MNLIHLTILQNITVIVIRIKKIIGKFNDELNGIALEEYFGLRSKCYSYIFDDKNDVKCKGIKKNILMNKNIKLDELLDENYRKR